MKLAMAQMRMDSMEESNLNKKLYFMEEAKRAGADLIFFPELQLSPFFPKYFTLKFSISLSSAAALRALSAAALICSSFSFIR